MAEIKNHSHVKILSPQVARKIAAGEVIDRPNAIVRELMDNAVDSGADKITVEITGGGIEKIRVIDNGCGMSKEDLLTCAHPHATSKISTEEDLLHLTTLGFRGEALSSMAAVSRLEIKSNNLRMNASITQDHILTPDSVSQGTIVETSALFENFPARRMFLKRPASEANLCRTTFEEKALARPDISFVLKIDGEEKLNLPKTESYLKRFVETMEFFEDEKLFFEIHEENPQEKFSFNLVLGEPSVSRSSRKDIYIFVNGRKIQEYSLVQAIEYGAQGYFPNGSHPVSCLFVKIDSSLVDFNIHPAKREVRFKDINPLHHALSTAVRNFFKNYTLKTMVEGKKAEEAYKTLKENQAKLFSDEDKSLKDKDAFSKKDPFESTYLENPPFSNYNFGKDKNQLNIRENNFNNADLKKYKAEKKDTASYFLDRSRYSNKNTSLAKEAFEEEIYFPSAENITKENLFNSNFIPKKEEINSSDDFHFVGMALGTFLIAQKNDTLYIIDQHAAHERYIYNTIMESQGQRQKLLIPYTIQTKSASDDNYLEAIKDCLEESGFECHKKEEGLWEFTSVPIRWKGSTKDLERDLLDRRINPKDMINAIAASSACRMAVMDHTVLDEETASDIARKALELPDPHCPHGRPVYTKITKAQLFALVKRT